MSLQFTAVVFVYFGRKRYEFQICRDCEQVGNFGCSHRSAH